MAESRSDDLTACLLALAAEQPSAVALLAPGRTAMSFGELGTRIHAVGAQLGAWGIGRGDIVAWATDVRAESAAALAIMPVAATLAPLDPGLTGRRLPRAAATPETEGRGRAGGIGDHPIGEAARRLGIAEIAVRAGHATARPAHSTWNCRARRPRSRSNPVAAPETVYVSATSGTTGRPKLVPHGQRQLLLTVRAMAERLAIAPGDVSAHVAPSHLANGMRTAFLLALLGGGAVACLPEADVDAFLAAVEDGEVTYTSASYTFMRELLRRVESGRSVGPGRLRFLRVASGHLDPDEIDRLAAAFRVPVVTGLASTESGSIAHQRLPPATRSRGSVGPPLACEIRLVDEQGRRLAPGAIGEIQVRGPQVFAGYFDDPELTAQAFADDWFRMGDLGRFDADGELHVVGRIDDVINRGGEKISPVEIDAALRTIPGRRRRRGVRDAASSAGRGTGRRRGAHARQQAGRDERDGRGAGETRPSPHAATPVVRRRAPAQSGGQAAAPIAARMGPPRACVEPGRGRRIRAAVLAPRDRSGGTLGGRARTARRRAATTISSCSAAIRCAGRNC